MYLLFDHSGQQIVILKTVCLVVEKVRERLAVNEQRSHRFHMGRFNLKN
jgi:hypothetical protein